MEEQNIYYDGGKVMSMLDLEKKKPSIFMITTNRSAGKTTYYLKRALEKFKATGKKVILLYRYNYELNSASDIFKDVLTIYSELGQVVTVLSHARGLFYELILDGETIGYSLGLYNPDSLKKFSPLFVDVETIIFDEYQTESGKYLPNEINKLQSLLLTIARGGGEQSRYVELIMLGNMVTIMNPYYIEFGIHKRLKDNTKFMRGLGWVAEFGFNESASNAIKENGIFRAFQDKEYMSYSTEKIYLHDALIFIDTPKGKSKYICTIIHDGVEYGVREYFEHGILFVSRKVDNSCKTVITFKASDHNQNSIMLGHYSFTWKNIKDAFTNGYLRFDDIKTKSAIFDILAIDLYK